MASIVIIGAGEIASALARQLAAADLVTHIVMVDEAVTVAQGKALDIMQAGPVDRYTTTITGSADLAAAATATVLMIADTAANVEWHDDSGLQLVKRLAAVNATAPIFCAGARQAGLIERAVGELGMPRGRVLGTAPEALRSAVIAMAALEAGCAPADVSLTLMGRPPREIIVPWDEGSIAGRVAAEALDPPAISRLEARLPRLWPPSPFTLGAAATRIARSALTRAPRVHSAFVAVTREEGETGRAVALPVRVQPSGLASIVTPALSIRDRVRLDVALG